MKRIRSRTSPGSISELGPCLFILFFVILLPLINLMWYGIVFVTLALSANFAVSQATVETNYVRSLAAMYNAASLFNSSNWSSFAKASPVAGYGGTGTDLYVKSTNIANHQIHSYGPNTSAPPPINTSENVWEFEVKAVYDVQPLINFSTVPFIGGVPGLGQTARLQYSAHKLAEHPEGLATSNLSNVFATQPKGSIRPTVSPIASGTGGGGVLPDTFTWFNPDIYRQIESAGQVIVSQEVLTVDSREYNWTDAGITINPGEKVWVDLRADGVWSNSTDYRLVDADGSRMKEDYFPYPLRSDAHPFCMLLGKVGDTVFGVGKYQLNLAPPGTGPLSFVFNDADVLSHYDNNVGVQTVRIIVTK